ncbi:MULTISPECIES: hypothetical protein [Streptomyces]|uniref:hypothetical protein n=1 Tax=Streptomyces TaxID=1883 RepID=UPI0012927F9A|nr:MULTISPECIES: hypothetical protein [Streptomyces]MCX5036112.1 hypothetical protein [Streptomyces coelicoflavus]QFX82362.1 hypothetical protein GEV49_16535 [Streptomyces sp. SYP-A7193]
MSHGIPHDLPPDPRTLVWYDRAALLTARSAAADVLAPHSMALRNLLWSWLATAVVAGGWCFAWVGLGWYLDLDDPEGADLLVTVVLVAVSLLVGGVAAAAFRRVVDEAAQRIGGWRHGPRSTACPRPARCLPGTSRSPSPRHGT